MRLTLVLCRVTDCFSRNYRPFVKLIYTKMSSSVSPESTPTSPSPDTSTGPYNTGIGTNSHFSGTSGMESNENVGIKTERGITQMDSVTGMETVDNGIGMKTMDDGTGMKTMDNGSGMKTEAQSVSGLRTEGEGSMSECVEIREGRARILFPSQNEVFYNPVQEFNRDLSIAVIKHYAATRPPSKKRKASSVPHSESTGEQGNSEESIQPGLRVLEALAASGLRSVRYALEIPQLDCVVANDYSKDAYNLMCRNVEHNGVGGRVEPSWREASMLMYECREPHSKRFDVIDLDPYGSPAMFLDSTIQAVQDGGLLCVTCTDMGVLCGNHSETCHSKYGSVSLKAKYCHEMALRIVLSSLESHANRYRRYIVPLLSCSIDFYVRLFVKVYTSPQVVKKSPSKLAMVYHCNGCESYHLQPLGKRVENGQSKKYPPGNGPPVDRKCEHCGFAFKFGGPMWAEPIHDPEFVAGLLKAVKESPKGTYNTVDRIEGLLAVISEELPDIPLYHVLDSVCSIMHANTPKMVAMRSAILHQGYRVSISHANCNAIKTDAPLDVFWDIMRCWVKENPIKTPSATSPCGVILNKEPRIQASFEIHKDANPPSRLLKLTRFPENPESHWGPKARAKRKKDNPEDLPAKRQRLQGKRSKKHNHDEEH